MRICVSNDIQPVPAPTLAEAGRGKQTIDGWGFDVEVLFIAQKRGYRIAEAGGQVGDQGVLTTGEGRAHVLDTQRRESFVQHRVRFRWTPTENTTGHLLVPEGPPNRPAVSAV